MAATLHINGWHEFTQVATNEFGFGDPFRLSALFRGQSDATLPLRPSLNRLFPSSLSEKEALSIEASILREFKLHASQLVPAPLHPSEESTVEWWALMQHHGVPTRLLDWTRSPYVAAYFAVANSWDKDGAIWIVHPRTLVKALQRKGISLEAPLDPIATRPSAPHVVSAALASKYSDRMIAQQGRFTFTLNILADHEQSIAEAIREDQEELAGTWYWKIVIPSGLKPDFLDQLRAMNVSANSLFPGIDGLGRSINELARIACFRKQGP